MSAAYTFDGSLTAAAGVTVVTAAATDTFTVTGPIDVDSKSVGHAATGTVTLQAASTSVASNTALTFDTAGPLINGVTFTADHKSLTVGFAGVYKITYSVTHNNAAGTASTWYLGLNGITAADAIAGSASGITTPANLPVSVVASIPAAATVALVNSSLSAATVVNASLSVTFLGIFVAPTELEEEEAIQLPEPGEALAVSGTVHGPLSIGGNLAVTGGLTTDTINAATTITYTPGAIPIWAAQCASIGSNGLPLAVAAGQPVKFRNTRAGSLPAPLGVLSLMTTDLTNNNVTTLIPQYAGIYQVTATIITSSATASTWTFHVGGTAVSTPGGSGTTYQKVLTLSTMLALPAGSTGGVSIVNAGSTTQSLLYIDFCVTGVGPQ